MKNAKEELHLMLAGKAVIKCALISSENWRNDAEPEKVYKLPLNYTSEDLQKFYASLDFDYDNGYGGQELFGTVWLEDGTWLSRGEYDGSEWWEHNKLPKIPDELL